MADNTQKMLQAIINGQSSFRQEVQGQFKKLEGKIESLDEKIDNVEKRLTARIDKFGKQLAYLEDDAPTREEFDNLEDRVEKIERKTVPN